MSDEHFYRQSRYRFAQKHGVVMGIIVALLAATTLRLPGLQNPNGLSANPVPASQPSSPSPDASAKMSLKQAILLGKWVDEANGNNSIDFKKQQATFGLDEPRIGPYQVDESRDIVTFTIDWQDGLKTHCTMTLTRNGQMRMHEAGEKRVQIYGCAEFTAQYVEFLAERDAHRAVEEARRLADIRAKNKRNAIRVQNLTKVQFIEAMRKVVATGKIDENGAVSEVTFVDFTFQDRFGNPDSNLEWHDGQRLFQYRCTDGAIQLQILADDKGTINVMGMNQY